MIAPKSGWKIILLAVFGGLVLGAIARLWMRWISTEPDFSWSGTIFIIQSFTIFATTQAVVYVLRRKVRTRRLTSIIRGGGILFSLPIFGGAGVVMLPTVALASIALWRKALNKWVRIALLTISLIPTVAIIIEEIGKHFGWNFVTLGKSLLFLLIYSTVVFLLKPTLTPYIGTDPKASRRTRIKTLIVVFIVLGVVQVGRILYSNTLIDG